jgi:putative flavoprotein involved in K+ transport
MDRYVLVIGAGQAGLAAGFHLRRAGLPFIIVEGSNHVGDVWRNRYDSLTLFTTRQLPGTLSFRSNWDRTYRAWPNLPMVLKRTSQMARSLLHPKY